MMKLRVRSVTWEAEGILSFELVHPVGDILPAFDAGAHLDVRVPGGLSRRYSLCGAPGPSRTYRIAVLNVPDSRGGSRAMHERVRAGDLLEVSEPHNFFPLDESAHTTLLLAGGIGITPIMAMTERLLHMGKRFQLHYCTRGPDRTAFVGRLEPLIAEGIVRLHHDHGDPRNGLDITGLLRHREEGTHLYYCGPTGFMKAVREASSHWPEQAVHCEYFGAKPSGAPVGLQSGAGAELKLARSGRTVPIAPDQTILQALRAAGVTCASSCEAGVCGTCELGYTDGDPEHNDLILSEDGRRGRVLVCCARVREGLVVLDL